MTIGEHAQAGAAPVPPLPAACHAWQPVDASQTPMCAFNRSPCSLRIYDTPPEAFELTQRQLSAAAEAADGSAPQPAGQRAPAQPPAAAAALQAVAPQAAAGGGGGSGGDGLAPALRLDCGELLYDWCWFAGMSAADPASCCLATTGRAAPVHLWDALTGGLVGGPGRRSARLPRAGRLAAFPMPLLARPLPCLPPICPLRQASCAGPCPCPPRSPLTRAAPRPQARLPRPAPHCARPAALHLPRLQRAGRGGARPLPGLCTGRHRPVRRLWPRHAARLPRRAPRQVRGPAAPAAPAGRAGRLAAGSRGACARGPGERVRGWVDAAAAAALAPPPLLLLLQLCWYFGLPQSCHASTSTGPAYRRDCETILAHKKGGEGLQGERRACSRTRMPATNRAWRRSALGSPLNRACPGVPLCPAHAQASSPAWPPAPTAAACWRRAATAAARRWWTPAPASC